MDTPSDLSVQRVEIKPHRAPEGDNHLLAEEDLVTIHNKETTFAEHGNR